MSDFIMTEELEKKLEDQMFEECFMDDVASLPETVRRTYLESEEAVQLEARARLINGKTRIRMSKEDDLSRRKTIGALIIAKERMDPLYKKFILFRTKEKFYKKQIIKKYGNKAERAARLSQKKYLRRTPSLSALKNKFGIGK